MKSKQVLDVQQMQHLQELWLKLDYNTMLSWIVDDRGKEKPLLCISSEALDYVDFNHYCLPAYTLQDVLDALPVTIEHGGKLYMLMIDMLNRAIHYFRYTEVRTFVKFKEIPFIDAAYNLLCWAIENGYVETNKNE